MKFDDPIGGVETDAVWQNYPAPRALEPHTQDAIGRVDVIKNSVPPTKPTVESKNNPSKRTLD